MDSTAWCRKSAFYPFAAAAKVRFTLGIRRGARG